VTTPTDEPLPAHRVALRAAVTAPIAAVLTTLAALVVVVAQGRSPRSFDTLLWGAALGTLGVTAWVGLLLVSEEVARRVPSAALRAPTVTLVGTGSALFTAAVVVWTFAIYDGRGAGGAFEAVAGLIDHFAGRPARTAQVVLMSLAWARWRDRARDG
jgi:hypothetical protein